MQKKFSFKIIHSSPKGKSRAGELYTPHGVVLTPAFVPVGTQATVKSLTPEDLKAIGTQLLFGNTYHLHLRPGEQVVKQFGGLAKFMGWDGVTITDSGGFQVFSLGVNLEHGMVKFLREDIGTTVKSQPRMNKITEEGVTFRSHLDGSTHILTPESSIQIQQDLGADLIVGFDDLESPIYDYSRTMESLELTNRWLLRSMQSHKRKDQMLYGVTHGGRFQDLRIESAKFNNQHFDAIALGGAHATKQNLYDVIDWTIAHVDEQKPKHLLGIGEVDDIFNAVERGVDTFDCVSPSRLGRVGHVFAHPPEGRIGNRFRYDIGKSQYALSSEPISHGCDCYVCKTFTRGYINHLFRAKELLAYRLATYHNIYFITRLAQNIRDSIMDDTFPALKQKWLSE